MPASDKQIIEWQLLNVSHDASKMSVSDLEWAIKIEDAYKRQKSLSPKQKQILEDIYIKYC